ncbi:MAG: immune inhibitor A [Myxococcota bacterium]|nr:immune inhibitor A [Myxococcota bacterium]
MAAVCCAAALAACDNPAVVPGDDGGPRADTGMRTDGGDVCEGRALCTTIGTSCDGDEVVRCASDADGCLVETREDCATSDQVCNVTGTTASCIDACDLIPSAMRCTTVGRSCEGETLQDCAANADGCLVITATDCAAAPGGECDTTGAMPMCVLPIDPCEAIPAAERCTTAGTSCTGDELVTCAPNAFGCLVTETIDCTDRTGGACDDSGAIALCTATDACAGITECAAAGTSCAGPELVTCQADAFGCLVETRDDCTDTMFGFCDGDAAPMAMCSTAATDPCMGMTACGTETSRSCPDGSTLEVCAPNAFGCFIGETTDCSAAGEACVSDPTPMCVDLCAGVDCSGAGGACGMAECNPANGLCEVTMPAADGTACDDENDCTTADVCTAGACDGTVSCEFDYWETFESGDGGWTTGGTASSWAWGAAVAYPTPPNGPNVWATNLTGPYNNGEDSFVASPAMDMTAATTDPVLRMSLYFETEPCCDEGWVEMSTDGGTTWAKLGEGGTGINWYNDAGNDWWDAGSGGWRDVQQTLTGAAGQADVRVRVVFRSDGSVTRAGFGVGEIRVRTGLANDLAVVAAVPSVPECPSAADPLEVTVRNWGTTTVTTYDVTITVDGAAPVTETVPTLLLPGEQSTYTTTAVFDLTAAGAHDIRATVALAGDGAPSNDTLETTFDGVPVVVVTAGAPYAESFDSGDGGWTSGGVNSTWAHGTPSGTFIPAAASGTGAWVTNPAGSYANQELSHVQSVCFDMSALTTDPTLSFSHIYETEGCCDEGWIEIWDGTTDTWTVLGASGEGTNWYNDATNDEWDGTSGASGVWRTASHALTGAAGNSRVVVRHRFASDGSVTEEGFGIDDVTITP